MTKVKKNLLATLITTSISVGILNGGIVSATTNDTPMDFSKTVATEGFPSIDKNTTRSKVKGHYFVIGRYVYLNDNNGTTFIGHPGILDAVKNITMRGDVILNEKASENNPNIPDNNEFGDMSISFNARTDRNDPDSRVLITVAKNWIGGNLSPEVSKLNHKLYLYSRWDKLATDTPTNTGLDSDLLVINGNVYGYTEIVPTKIVKNVINPITDSTIEDHTGETYYALSDREVGENIASSTPIITPGAPLVTVKGKSQYKNSFFGNLPIANGKIAHIVPYDNGKEGAENIHGFTWGWIAEKPSIPGGDTGAENPPNNNYIPNIPNANSYNPSMPGILSMPKLVADLGMSLTGTLHQRLGDQVADNMEPLPKKEHQTWGRYIHNKNQLLDNGQFSIDNNIQGLQVGSIISKRYDLDNNGKITDRKEKGISLGYLRNNADLTDRNQVIFDKKIGKYIGKELNTGTARYDLGSIGLYATNYQVDKKYYQDWVAQLFLGRSDLHTFTSENNPADTKGHNSFYGIGLSYEAGRPLNIGKKWTLEGQSQLAYQQIHFNGFEEGILNVSSLTNKSLVGRLGIRYYKNVELEHDKGTNRPYITANIMHDFYPTSGVKVGGTEYRPSYNRTWYSLGIGGKHEFGKNTYGYGDLRYEHSIGKGYLKGWQGIIGLHHTF